MLGYAHINLISMLKRLESEKVVRVASDSLYIQKNALHKLEGVVAYNVKDQKIQAEVLEMSFEVNHCPYQLRRVMMIHWQALNEVSQR